MIPPVYYRRVAPLEKNSAILLSLLRALSDLDRNFPLPYAVFLLEVAQNEGCSLGDLQKATGMPLPTLSRKEFFGPCRPNARTAPSRTG